DEGRIELHERGSGPDLRVGVGSAGDSADADERQTALGEPVDLAQQLGREGEERSPAEAAALRGVAAAQSGRPARGRVTDDQSVDAAGERDLRDIADVRGPEVRR